VSQFWIVGARIRRSEGEEPVGRRGFRPAGRSSPGGLFVTLPGILEPITFPIGFDDVDPMSDAIQKSSSQSLAPHDFASLFKREIGRHNQTEALVGSAHDFEEQLRSVF